MSILLVGCGYWGKNWAKTLAKLDALGAICEPSPPLQATLKQTYPDIAIYNTLEEALQHPGITGCVLATPVVTHTPVAKTCLLAGKHVLVEKPLTLDPTEAGTLVALAKQENLILGVGHLMVYQPALLKLQSLISEGELGDILSVQCTRINLGKVRNEENVWWSLAPHDLSILAMLFSAIGESFDAINAIKMTPLARPGIEDAVFAQFETPSGKNASIHVSWLSPEKRHETVVIGSRKIAVFEDTQPADQKLSIMDYDLKRSEEGFGDITRGEFTPVSYETPKDDLLTLEAKAFLNAIASSQGSNAAISLQNDGENGLQVVQMLDKVQQMLNTRQPSLSVR